MSIVLYLMNLMDTLLDNNRALVVNELLKTTEEIMG